MTWKQKNRIRELAASFYYIAKELREDKQKQNTAITKVPKLIQQKTNESTLLLYFIFHLQISSFQRR